MKSLYLRLTNILGCVLVLIMIEWFILVLKHAVGAGYMSTYLLTYLLTYLIAELNTIVKR